MSGSGAERGPADDPREAERGRRLREIFGDVLPDVTRDELPDAAPASGDAATVDEWLRANRPPHHDDRG